MLDGTKIVKEYRTTSANGTQTNVKYYFYDASGSIAGFEYNGNTYYFQKNIQGDIIRICDTSGNTVAEYTYDAWGKILSIKDGSGNDVSGNASHIANINPFRYRGYYYDTETGFYYLQTRYYDPEVGRFLSPDDHAIIIASTSLLNDKNYYAYCDNNPITRVDDDGEFWLTSIIFGVVGQYVSDVVHNVIDGKTGWDILKPTSSIGTYVAAGVTSLIPGSGIASAFARSAASETIVTVEKAIKGEGISVGEIAFNVFVSTGVDFMCSKASDKISESIKNKGPQNYSSYAGKQYKKNPAITKAQIYTKMRQADRANRFARELTESTISTAGNVLCDFLP